MFVSKTLTVSLAVQGGEREYLLRLPALSVPRRDAVVIELHGSGLCAERQLRTSGLHGLAYHEGVIIAAPQAVMPLHLLDGWPAGTAWNIPGVPLVNQRDVSKTGPDEQAFILALLDDLLTRFVPPKALVFLVGYSGGARLASYLAHTLPGRFAAIATVSGLRNPCVEPIGILPPIIAFHGRKDPINPFDGGVGPRWNASVLDTANTLAQLRGCPASISVTENCIGGTRIIFRDLHRRTQLVQYVLDEGNHGWPGSRDPEHVGMFGAVSASVDASQRIWDFFATIYDRPTLVS
ncbi:hypothetical protein NUV28_12255 [Burkholderia cenocepacia]|nr:MULTISPECIES: PHB depolymerase family esterase [Burkholderia cepacia complex]MDO5948168.1 PHB depolymerase family esterase [Burkholderia cepacia]MDS0803607.1 hypothetical protein [Burkholderia cenocepacia]